MEDNRINRPVHKKRKLRWGRLVFLLILLSAFFTAAFWGSVWVYDNLINPPQAKIIGADEKIVSDEKLNERINILLLGIDDATVRQRLLSPSVLTQSCWQALTRQQIRWQCFPFPAIPR